MRFSTFLLHEVGGLKPIDRVKRDLSHYKTVFAYAERADILYDNLIDNIFWLLDIKFQRFQFRYTRYETCYNEFNLILSSQLPQFLLIQKKQILEKLNTFGDLKNWGQTTKEAVSRTLTGNYNQDNITGYVPIDGNDTDPYSKDMNNSNNRSEEIGVNERNTNDFLEFYSKIRWDVGSIPLNDVLKPYYELFTTIQGAIDNDDITPNLYDELNQQIQINKSNIGIHEDDIFKLTQDNNRIDLELDDVKDQVNQNTQDIGEKANIVDVYNKQYIDTNIATKTEVALKANSAEVYTKNEVFNKDETNRLFPTFSFLSDRHYNKRQTDEVLALKANDNEVVKLTGNQTIEGDKIFNSVVKVATPQVANDATTKEYVDNLINSIPALTTVLNLIYPIGSVVISVNGSTHALVNSYPNNFEEISGSEETYLAVSRTSGVRGSNTKMISSNNLPPINLSHRHLYGVETRNTLQKWNFGSGGEVWNGTRSVVKETDETRLFLNNATQQAMDIKPKTIGIRMWKVIRSF